ncbi:DUF4412 domain-containing protein [Herbiconiux daphne]|uniref:DUF4412 domain-containing protein n=1 Tax=Herbiconiux daphne TaxID=2970914 RepID=A0ABT2GWS8_9MICO|nr:DUF4412 domain-containing protein [Herbiconiux daphne]MCS5732373.1 DUF4412 domain-containing protein [Herbiconiux daphne]
MSTLRHPVGPQPKKVYWRRRLVLGFVLVAIIAIVVLIIVRPGSGAGAGADASVATSSPAAGDTAPATTAAPATPGAVDSGSDTPAGEVAACAAGNISVVPVTDAATYEPGVNPQLSFTITNTGSEACKINAGTSQQIYTITSGEETYWVSTDCQTDPSDTQAVLEPGVGVSSTPFSWDRTRSSAETCTATDRPQVPAAGASYHLNVRVAGIDSAETQQFILN